MYMNNYQERAQSTAIYPSIGKYGLPYVALGLSGEAGEIANKVKKVYRDNGGELSLEVCVELAEELGDLLWYVALFAKEIGYDMNEIARLNLEKLARRKVEGTLKGEGMR